MNFSELLSPSQKADFAAIGLDPDAWIQQMLANFARQASALRSGDTVRKLNALPPNAKASIEATINSEYVKVVP